MSDRKQELDGVMEELHDAVVDMARAYLTYMRETPAAKMRAGMFAAVCRFLKDNDVTAESIRRRQNVAVTQQARGAIALPFPSTKAPEPD
jgi:hypothetical protein